MQEEIIQLLTDNPTVSDWEKNQWIDSFSWMSEKQIERLYNLLLKEKYVLE